MNVYDKWHKLSDIQPEEGQVCIFLRATYSSVYGVVSYKQTLREAMVKSLCRGAWTPLARYIWWMPAPGIPGPEDPPYK